MREATLRSCVWIHSGPLRSQGAVTKQTTRRAATTRQRSGHRQGLVFLRRVLHAAGVSAPTGGRGHAGAAVALALASLGAARALEPVPESGQQPVVNGLLSMGLALRTRCPPRGRGPTEPLADAGEGGGLAGKQGHL